MELKINNKILFDEATHTYINEDGVLLAGVTSVMKKMGVYADYVDIPQATLDAAAYNGTLVHKAIEDWCDMERRGEVNESAFAFEPAFVLEALDGYKKLGVKALANEYLVSDNEYMATFIDIVEETEDQNMVDLCDIKYTSQVHKEALSWQLSLGKYLFELQNPTLKVRNLYCIHLKGEAKRIPVRKIDSGELSMFINCFIKDLPYSPQSSLIALNTQQEEAVKALLVLESKIIALEAEQKAYKAQQEAIKEGVLKFMASNGLTRWEISKYVTFTYVEPTVRKSLDSKRLAQEMPKIYNEYLKESKVKASLRIHIKEDKTDTAISS